MSKSYLHQSPDNQRPQQLSGHCIIRLNDACKMLGYSAKHIRYLERTGQFPPRVQLGPKSVGWRRMDIKAWIDSRLQTTTEPGSKVEGTAS